MPITQIQTQFNVRSVAQSALIGGIVCAAGATLWQLPAAREFATSPGFKKALLDGISKLIDGGASSPIVG